MQLRDALDDYKRNTGHDTRFPGERRTVTGRFSGGRAGSLVHVDADGELRDFGYPLTGQTGLVRSRVGLAVGDEVTMARRGRDPAALRRRYDPDRDRPRDRPSDRDSSRRDARRRPPSHA